MKHPKTWILLALFLAGALLIAAPAWAHQPFFEETDIPPDRPWRIADPSVSTAVYATLESSQDVDVFAFDGQAGQEVYLSIVIPQIPGQEDFAPTVALIGPGLPEGRDVLPEAVPPAKGDGVELIPPPEGTPSTFFEPFTRTSYWERQERTVILPADSLYRVAIWHPQGAVGRYVFTVGRAERLGGDPAFMAKLRRYWTSVGAPPPGPPRRGAPLDGAGLLRRLPPLLGLAGAAGRSRRRPPLRRRQPRRGQRLAGRRLARGPAAAAGLPEGRDAGGAGPVRGRHRRLGTGACRAGAGSGACLLPLPALPGRQSHRRHLRRLERADPLGRAHGDGAGPDAGGRRQPNRRLVGGLRGDGSGGLPPALRRAGPLLAVWAGNLALVLWKHRRDLRTPPAPAGSDSR